MGHALRRGTSIYFKLQAEVRTDRWLVCNYNFTGTTTCRFDDLHNYVNERSAWLAQLRDRIEEPWQAWEQQQMAAAAALEKAEEGGSGGAADTGVAAYQNMSLEEMKEGLRDR